MIEVSQSYNNFSFFHTHSLSKIMTMWNTKIHFLSKKIG